MTDIILSTQNGEPVVSSRQIAENFGKEHKNVLQTIDNMTAENSALLQMFHLSEYTTSQNKKLPMYLMNRDGFSLLVMGFTGKAALEWKLKYIQAFNEMEKKLAQRPQLSRSELMAQALIAAHDELEHKDRQIAELTPKGIFADAVSASKKSILVGELAKLLCQNGVQIGQNRLFVWMREHGFLIRDPKRSDYNMPTQRAVEHGLFEIKETTVVHSDGHTSINKTPKVTGKGQVYFVNQFMNGRDRQSARGRSNVTRYIWMEVTPDKYELPVAVADSLSALAKLLGVTPAAISHSVHKFGDRGKYRRVEI